VAPDGKGYAYCYARLLSDLFVVEGSGRRRRIDKPRAAGVASAWPFANPLAGAPHGRRTLVPSLRRGVPRTIPFPDVTLPELLDRTVAQFPDRVALRFFLDARLPAPP